MGEQVHLRQRAIMGPFAEGSHKDRVDSPTCVPRWGGVRVLVTGGFVLGRPVWTAIFSAILRGACRVVFR